MFKKPVELKGDAKIKGSEKKKLKADLLKSFPLLSEDMFGALFPAQTDISVGKLGGGSRLRIYQSGGVPVILDLDGRGDYYPTVMGLWRAPTMVPILECHWPVSHYLLGGADLMFPGVRVPPGGLPSLCKGEKVGVKVAGNPAAVAIGFMEMDAAAGVAAGMKGKAVGIVQHFKDCMWMLSKELPNEGFTQDAVMPVDGLPVSDDEEDKEGAGTSGETAPDGGDGGSETGLEVKLEDVVVGVEDGEESKAGGTEEGGEEDAEESRSKNKDRRKKGGKKGKGKRKDGEVNSDSEDDSPAVSPAEMDALLEKSFFQAVRFHFKDRDLPTLVNIFFANYIAPARPRGTSLDIKRSTYKKLLKFLQALQSRELLKLKETQPGVFSVVDISRAHPDMRAHERHEEEGAATPEDATTGPTSGSTSAGGGPIEVTETWKPKPAIAFIFPSDHHKSRTYTIPECRSIFTDYMEKENLTLATNKSKILMTPLLTDALYKSKKKPEGGYPTELTKQEATTLFCDLLQAHHTISGGTLPFPVTRNGKVSPVIVATDMRHGHKATKVTGLETFGVDPEAVSTDLQRTLASACSVQPVPHKETLREVVVQGFVHKRVAEVLMKNHFIPKKYIVVDDTKGKPKGKGR